MQFNTYSYLIALAITVTIFWLLPQAMRRGFVLAASLAFYASWSVPYTLLPLGICAIAYIFARGISKHPGKARGYLTGGVTLILLTFIFFKYRVFLLGMFHFKGSDLGNFVLPLGISFYSFEAISYLIDTRQGRVKEVNLLDLALFILFWPHLIAGPIVRVRELVPQLKFDRPFAAPMLYRGLDRLLWGLVQKNVFANSIGGWVDDGFVPRVAALNTTLDTWFLAAAFGLQIYFDFAAYTNLAIGAAQLIGVSLPENFRFPYLAATPPDFWNRWHMTLSRWIRDYLFFPLTSRYKDSPAMLYLSLIFVMSLVGLWHGAGYGYILWGALHGCFLVLYRIFGRPSPSWLERAGWRLFTVIAVTSAWIPFRATSLDQTRTLFHHMFLELHLQPSYSINFYLTVALLSLLVLIEPLLSEWETRFEGWLQKRPVTALANAYLTKPLLYAFGLFLFMIFDDLDKKFIYFQF